MQSPPIDMPEEPLVAPAAAAGGDSASAPAATAPSYHQILRSSSILGGSQGLIYIISIARTKAAALLLGPSGVGTLSLFQSIVGLLGTVSGLGIGNSAVREIAEASGTGDAESARRTSSVVFRLAIFSGLLGWVLAAVLAFPISKIAFGDFGHSVPVALLGACLLLGSAGSAFAAMLQGTRDISTLAKFQVASNGGAAVVAVTLYLIFGEKAIVPSIIAGSVVSFLISWAMGHKTFRSLQRISWKETFKGSKTLVSMGIAFMWNAFSTGLVAFGIRVIVVRQDGLDANGIYQAAWAISGMFAGFILQAMGTDFYPRLTAASSDPPTMNRLINEQTEIGILLAGPGVLFTLCFAPYLMEWLYSARFAAGTPVVCWFVLGVFGQVISWPLGFVQIARGWPRAFMVTQTIYNTLHFGLTALLFRAYGLVGIGVAYVLLYVIYTVAMLVYMRKVNEFHWSPEVRKLILIVGLLVGAGFALAISSSGLAEKSAGLALSVAGGYFCAKELVGRLPSNHLIRKLLAKLRFIPD